MANIAVSTIVGRVATAISTALSATGWRQSTCVYDQFGSGESDNRYHKGFAVGAISTKVRKDRQRVSVGAQVDTDIRVRWAYNVAAMDQVDTYALGLDSEQLILNAVMSVHGTDSLHLDFVDMAREVDDQGWMTGEMTFSAYHSVALS